MGQDGRHEWGNLTPTERENLTAEWRRQNREQERQRRAQEQAMPEAQRKMANDLMRQQGPSWRQGTADVPRLYGLDALSLALLPNLPQYEAERQEILGRTQGQRVTGLPPNAYDNLQVQTTSLPAVKSWMGQQVAPLFGQPIAPITSR